VRVYNKHHRNAPPDAVFVGRPSKWGNPFIRGVHGTREQVIEKFKTYLDEHPTLLEAARKELRGKDLVCFCWPAACHAEVLLKAANKRTKSKAAIRANQFLKDWTKRTECVGVCVQSMHNGKLCTLGKCERLKFI